MTEALKQSGFRIVAAIDNDPVCCRTYRTNHPEVHLYENDIRDVDPGEIKRNDLDGKDVDLLVVCAPCQPFSSLNRKDGDDGRALLILEAVRFANVLRPKLIFFENVPGLSGKKFRHVLDKLRSELRKCGYNLGNPLKMNASDYGVPQRRKRCVLFATKLIDPPSHLPPAVQEEKRMNVRQAIGDLPPLEAGMADPDDPLHAARSISGLNIKRLAHIPKNGGSRDSLPPALQLKCHKNHSGHPDVYGRMAWDSVAPTLTTGCTDITRGRFAHPEQNRPITLREAARLQTFADTYKFEGTPTQIARQIGNAVPVKLVKALAPQLHETIRRVGLYCDVH